MKLEELYFGATMDRAQRLVEEPELKSGDYEVPAVWTPFYTNEALEKRWLS